MDWWKYSGQKLCVLADVVLKRQRVTEEELHTALAQLLEGARQQYIGAFTRLGRCYEQGIGVEADDTTAMEYYRMAADRGDENAQKDTQRLNPLYYPRQLQETDLAKVPTEWGELTANGLCEAAEKESDEEKRGKLIRYAMDMDSPRGMLLCGQELERRGDTDGAQIWFRRAALHGSEEAVARMKVLDPLYDPDLPDTDPLTGDQLYQLAEDFRRGIGRPANESIFERLSAMAAARNNGQAAQELGIALHRKGELSRAVPFLQTASAEGFGAATDLLGQMTQRGEGGLMENYAAAYQLFVKAAEQNSGAGAFHAGECCEKGYGVEQNIVFATEWYLKAAKLGEKAAIEPMKRTADAQDDPKLKYRCGHWLLYDGAKRARADFKAAFQLLSAAADARIPEAYFDLGLMYRDGRYVYSKQKAMEYLEKAKQMGISGVVPERNKMRKRTVSYLTEVLPSLLIPVLVFAAVLFVVVQLERMEVILTSQVPAVVSWIIALAGAAGFMTKHYFIAHTYSVRPLWQELLWLTIFPGAGVIAALVLAGTGTWNLLAVALSMMLSAVLTALLVQHESMIKDALWVGLRLIFFVPGSILAAALLNGCGVPMKPGWSGAIAIAVLAVCVLILVAKQYYLYSERLDMDNFVVCGVLAMVWPGAFLIALTVFCWQLMAPWVLAFGMVAGTLLHCIISENLWGVRETD